MVQIQPTREPRSKTIGNPHTGVWGWFRSHLQARPSQTLLNPLHGSVGIVQIPPTSATFPKRFLNPPHRSVGIVQIPPTSATFPNAFESPTRQCGDCSDPTYKRDLPKTLLNPPHGSVGIVQIPPTRSGTLRNRESHPRAVTGSGWMVQIRPPLHTDTT